MAIHGTRGYHDLSETSHSIDCYIFPIESHWDFHDWLVVSNMFYFLFHIWDVILPIITFIFFKMVKLHHQPDENFPTRFLHRFPTKACGLRSQAPQFGSRYGLMGHGLEALYKVPSFFTMWMVWLDLARASADVFFSHKNHEQYHWHTMKIPWRYGFFQVSRSKKYPLPSFTCLVGALHQTSKKSWVVDV